MTGKYYSDKLQEENNLLVTVFECSPYIMILVDDEGHIEKINRLGSEFAGSTQKELTGSLLGRVLRCVDLLDGKSCGNNPVCENCPIFTRMMASIKKGVSIRNEEAQLMIRKDGAVFPLDFMISTAPVKVADQTKILVSIVDITERKRAERALLASEERNRQAVENSPNPIFSIDKAGFIQTWNQASEKTFQYGQDIIGEHFQRLLRTADDEITVKTMLAQVSQGQSLSDIEMVYRSRDGSARPTVSRIYPIFDRMGITQGYVFANTDMTERNRVVQMLKEREAELNAILRAAPIGIGMVIDRVIHEANDMLCTMTGYSREELIGKNARFLYPTQAEYEYVGLEKYRQIAENEQGTVETRWRQKNGEIRDILLSSAPIEPSDLSRGVTFSALDITERKNVEIALRESAERYQAVVEDQNEFIVRWKMDGTRTFVNEAYLRYYDLTREEALSTSFNSLIVKEDRAAVEEKISRLLTGEIVSETDIHRVIRPDGTIGWQEWTDRVVRDEKGKVVELQSVGRDVTERILADAALRMKTEELEALFSISAHLRSAQSADAMLPVVLAEMRRVLHSDANAVILLDSDNEHFTYALGDGPLAVNYGLRFSVDQSISGLVLQTRQPYVTKDFGSDPHKASGLQGDNNLGPAILVPVVSEAEFLGVLLCARIKASASRQYSLPEVRLLTAVGEMVGNALRRARLFDQALKRLQHLQTLHSIDTAISANLDLNVILEVLLSQGVAQLNVDAACVLLLDPHTHLLEYAASKGIRSKELRAVRLRLGDGLPGEAALDRKAIYIPNLSNQNVSVRTFLLGEGFISYQAAPLVAKGKLRGVLEVFSRKPMEEGEEQTGFLETLATQAAIAIDNSQLFSDLQRSNFELEMAYDATIEGWSRALELRDRETEGHTQRVADMTLQLAKRTGVRNEEMIHIRRGALLHDIGKMGVPDRVLLKPDKLVGEEWELMKQHTVYAFKMLWPIEFLRPAINIPHCHHERWDGTGYPRQLKGEQIPLAARLFAIADVWDALTSDRPYRKAWTEERALEYFRANRGKHFDPRIVELFLDLQKRNS